MCINPPLSPRSYLCLRPSDLLCGRTQGVWCHCIDIGHLSRYLYDASTLNRFSSGRSKCQRRSGRNNCRSYLWTLILTYFENSALAVLLPICRPFHSGLVRAICCLEIVSPKKIMYRHAVSLVGHVMHCYREEKGLFFCFCFSLGANHLHSCLSCLRPDHTHAHAVKSPPNKRKSPFIFLVFLGGGANVDLISIWKRKCNWKSPPCALCLALVFFQWNLHIRTSSPADHPLFFSFSFRKPILHFFNLPLVHSHDRSTYRGCRTAAIDRPSRQIHPDTTESG